jgi:hypothetical protein
MDHLRAVAASAFFFLCATGAIVAGGLVGVPAAHAADCDITTADVAQIAAIQNDPTLSSSDETKQELALRQQLVGETIACAQQEVQTFRSNLAGTSVESDAQPLQSQLLGDLDEATGFYNSELLELNVVGIAGTKSIAQEVLAWRASTFIPLSENVNNFILWSEDQNLFDTARTRMNETQSAVSFLESASLNNDLQAAFSSVQSSFNDAQNENAAAETALAGSLSPDQSLALIKQSLGSLAATYQGFSTVSTLIKNILSQ